MIAAMHLLSACYVPGMMWGFAPAQSSLILTWILGAGMFLWCPSFRWGNWGSEDWKDFVQSLNDTMAGLEICTQSLGEIWASPIKWGLKKPPKLKHFLLTYCRHFRGWILPWVWPWPSVCKVMEERLCLPNPPHLLSGFLPSEAQSPHEMPGLRPPRLLLWLPYLCSIFPLNLFLI